MNIEIANRLRQMRSKNNLSQEELAAKIGVSRQAVSKWERAEASPDTENLILLARLYGVSIDELLRTEETPASNGVSLKKEDYGYTDKPQKELYPKNYTDEEIYPGGQGVKIDQSTSTPQGSPFGADISEEERKSSEGIGEKMGKAGIAIGDMLNSAGEAIRSGSGDWDDKLEKKVDKFCQGLEKGMDKLHCGIEKGVDKLGEKYDKYNAGSSGNTGSTAAKQPKPPATLLDKIFPIIIVFMFFACCGIDLAHPGWTLFLLIPLYYTGKEALRKRNPLIFCYPVFCAFVYFSIGGFFDMFFHLFSGPWYEIMWLLFLTIPLYYTLFPALRKRNPLIFCYPVLAVIIYLGFGIVFNYLWNWAGETWFSIMWAPLGLSIPLYYIIISHYRNKKNTAGQSAQSGQAGQQV